MLFTDFLAQLADVDVDRAVADHDVRAPDPGIDLVARNEFPGALREQLQQGELLAGQGDLLSAASDRVAFALLEL